MFLTQCNNCSSIFEDKNNSYYQKKYADDTHTDWELVLLEDEEEYYRWCPNCKTDWYLKDI